MSSDDAQCGLLLITMVLNYDSCEIVLQTYVKCCQR